MKKLFVCLAVLAISIGAMAATKKVQSNFDVRPGMVMKCPVQVLVVDKETGLKGAEDSADFESRGYFVSELVLDTNLMAEQSVALKDGRSVDLELRKDETLNLFSLAVYIVDPKAQPRATSYFETLLKFEKISTGGGWDGESGTGKYSFIKGSLEPRTGYATIDYRVRKALVEANLIPSYLNDSELDVGSLSNFVEPLKAAVKKNILKDGQVIGVGTVFFCSLK